MMCRLRGSTKLGNSESKQGFFYNSASLKLKHARCMRADAKKYYTVASRKLEKTLVSKEGNTNVTNISVPERQASIKARAALKKQKNEKQI